MSATTTHELAARLRLHRSAREWRGDCPLCGYRDALVLGTGRGGVPLLWCAACLDRDGLHALQRSYGVMPRTADAPPAEATPDEQAGLSWFNGLSTAACAYWLADARSARAVDAWRAYKRATSPEAAP